MMTQEVVEKYADVFEIDANLCRLVQRIELLNFVNPQNIEAEKRRFFAHKYSENPKFHYPKRKFDAYKLHRLFYSQRLERIEDDEIRKLYQDVIYFYSGMIQCIENIGKGTNFYFNSLRSYGTPKERNVENAKFILHFEDEEEGSDMIPAFTAEEAKEYFQAFAEQYDFDLNVKLSTKLAAEAMVSNSTQTLLLKKNVLFSENQLKTLANHEIGVHLVTTYNGLDQPLKIFSNGLPKNVETQEGLAVFAEYMSGALTLKRLKELAYRVIAVDSLLKGYDFKDTFDLLHNQYKLNRDSAFTITLRVHRGGGFTKDYLYLTGLKKVYDYFHAGKDLGVLLTGKTTLSYAETIKKLQKLGLSKTSTYFTSAFVENNNQNKTLDFILQNLK
ncbi:flavohemoglobin expression-modulating QEGLA motif protein [Sungkyunkwania multivorans]|uniref:Flavohemoglobin expression-modulating QEGLA motif protein n=1 Tax=Sungkyunkwania multivorans TaxID=1173618 RepID=A0ABW3CWG2_9FLAO